MTLAPLSSLVDISMGSAPPSTAYNDNGEGVPMIAGAGDFGQDFPRPKKWTRETTRLANKGDLIVCVRATIGDLNWADREYCLGRGVAGFRAKPGKADLRYIARALEAKKDEFSRLGTGSTFLAIRRGEIEDFEIPLPPTLDEQKRIAAVLDKADALRRQRQESLQLTEKLLQSVFIDMFGDPITNPKGWPLLELGRFGIVQTGNTPPRSDKANYSAEGIEWIKTDNIVEGRVTVTLASEKLSEKGFKLARVAPAGSLLVACIAGSEKSIGRAALTDRKVAFNQQINSITPHADTSGLFLYFLAKIARRQFQEAAAKGMKKMLNKSTFENLLLIAPGYEEQLQFESVAKLLIAQSEDCHEQVRHLDGFFSSVQQRAFRGLLDLNRLTLEPETTLSTVVVAPGHSYNEGVYNRPGYFIAPPEVEEQMMALEERLDTGPGDSIPWSENYFKYRILSQLLLPPFSFSDIWEKVEYDMPEASYETVKDKVFEYVAAGILEQQFDEESKEIVFHPRS